MNCILCDIVKGERPAEIIYQDEHLICFLDIEPINDGHLLIVPGQHYADLPDLPNDIAHHIMVTSKMLTTHLLKVLHADGVTVMQNNGHYNEIGHYHMHLVPRYANDNFKWVYPKIERGTAKIKQVADKLRLALKS